MRKLREILKEPEEDAIIEALNEAGGHYGKAARLLGISRSGLYLRIKRLKLKIQPFFKK